MRVWRDILGVFLIGLYLVFFSMSWANALTETPKNTKNTQVLSAHSTFLPTPAGLPSAEQMLTLTNQTRKDSDLPALSPNSTLTSIAQQRADDMAARRYYAHRSPDGTYYYNSLESTQFKQSYSCENLGMDSTVSADTYVSQWLASNKGHKECLLNSTINQVGYGVAEVSFDPAQVDNKTYIVVAIHASN